MICGDQIMIFYHDIMTFHHDMTLSFLAVHLKTYNGNTETKKKMITRECVKFCKQAKGKSENFKGNVETSGRPSKPARPL